MKITIHEDSCLVRDKHLIFIQVHGNLTGGQASQMLRSWVKRALESKDGVVCVSLNLKGLKTIDTSGICALVSALHSTRNKGGEMWLVHLNREVRHEIAKKMSGVFPVRKNEQSVAKRL